MRTACGIALNATTLGGTTVVNSSPFSLNQAAIFAYAYTVAGSVFAGSLQIQVSCDEDSSEDGRNVANWSNLGAAITISAAGTTAVNVPDVGYTWARAVWTPASGTGALSLRFVAKG